jgi:hypothetical protein
MIYRKDKLALFEPACNAYELAEYIVQGNYDRSGGHSEKSVSAAGALLKNRDKKKGFKRCPMLATFIVLTKPCSTPEDFADAMSSSPMIRVCTIHAKAKDKLNLLQTQLECSQLSLIRDMLDGGSGPLIFTGDFNLSAKEQAQTACGDAFDGLIVSHAPLFEGDEFSNCPWVQKGKGRYLYDNIFVPKPTAEDSNAYIITPGKDRHPDYGSLQ